MSKRGSRTQDHIQKQPCPGLAGDLAGEASICLSSSIRRPALRAVWQQDMGLRGTASTAVVALLSRVTRPPSVSRSTTPRGERRKFWLRFPECGLFPFNKKSPFQGQISVALSCERIAVLRGQRAAALPVRFGATCHLGHEHARVHTRLRSAGGLFP